MTAISSLDLARKAVAARRADGLPTERLTPIEKSRRHPTSLRLAINGKCWWCIGEGADANPRSAIRDCTITDCTLHPVRPYQSHNREDAA